jgi:hypothetical protein
MSESAGNLGRALAVPTRAAVLMRAAMRKGVMILPMREDRESSGNSNHSKEGLLLLEPQQFF